MLLTLSRLTSNCAPLHGLVCLYAGQPVSAETLAEWQGFVRMILTGWFDKRIAWYPVPQLQMEVSAVLGMQEPPHVVAEWLRIVRGVLDVVAPQF